MITRRNIFVGTILNVALITFISLGAQAQTDDWAEIIGEGIGGPTSSAENHSGHHIPFVKNGQRLCKAAGGFFVDICMDRQVGKKADAFNTQIGDYCDVMITGETIVYKLPDFYGTEGGSEYLSVKNRRECKILSKNVDNPPTVRQSSVLTKKDLDNAPILGKSSLDQPAQIVVKTNNDSRWVMVYKSEYDIPVVELRDSQNVKIVVDRYLLAKGNAKVYEDLIGFRTLNCKKMAEENHDVRDQIQKKNYNETCLQVVGKNDRNQYINLAIIPSSKLKNHLFRSLEVNWIEYTVESQYSEEDFLIDLLTLLFGA